MAKRKRKLPPGVVGMAEFKDRKRLEQIGRNARAFLALPPAERARQLIELIEVRVIVGEEKKPGD
jgi:hypothetical protein